MCRSDTRIVVDGVVDGRDLRTGVGYYIREYNVTHGVAPALAYNGARAVSYAGRRGRSRGRGGAGVRERVMGSARESPGTSHGIKLALAWGCVGIPLVWGIIQTLVNAIKAFQ